MPTRTAKATRKVTTRAKPTTKPAPATTTEPANGHAITPQNDLVRGARHIADVLNERGLGPSAGTSAASPTP